MDDTEGCVASSAEPVRVRYGRLPWQKGVLWKWERSLVADNDELVLVCYSFLQRTGEWKKQRMCEWLWNYQRPLWLSGVLLHRIGPWESRKRKLPGKWMNAKGKSQNEWTNRRKLPCEWTQPEWTEDLELFRLRFLRQREEKRRGRRLQAMVIWESEKDPCSAVSLLPEWIDGINFLTVIGGERGGYVELEERLWQEEGLPVRYLEKPVQDYPYGPDAIWLNLEPGRGIPKWVQKKGGFCLDISGQMLKFLDTVARNGYNT